jgi:hypothetical protein
MKYLKSSCIQTIITFCFTIETTSILIVMQLLSVISLLFVVLFESVFVHSEKNIQKSAIDMVTDGISDLTENFLIAHQLKTGKIPSETEVKKYFIAASPALTHSQMFKDFFPIIYRLTLIKFHNANQNDKTPEISTNKVKREYTHFELYNDLPL